MSNVFDFNTALPLDQLLRQQQQATGETTEERRERIKAMPLSSIISQHIRLTRRGPELVGLCPFHNDHHPSLTVNDRKGVWKCFSCDAGGDAIEFVQQYTGATFLGAMDLIEGKEPARPVQPPVQRTPIERQPDPAKLLPEEAPLGAPTGTWHYLDGDSNVIATVHRYDLANGGKTYRPWDAKQRKHTMPETRPLYNLPGILFAEPVVLVEGEKAADALIRLGYNATTAMGGANAPLDKTDWQGIAGKRVIVWPDADAAGEKYRDAVVPHLRALGCTVSVVVPPQGVKKGWDAADADTEQAIALVQAAAGVDEAPQPVASSGKFGVIDLDALMAMEPPPWRVDGLLPEESFAVLYGPSGNGKTFVALDVCLCMAHGIPWHGRQTVKSSVLYIAAEGVAGLGKRIQAWHKAYGLDHRKALFRVVPCTVNMLDGKADVAEIIKLIEGFGDVSVVVIDTLARSFVGGDENDAKDMGSFVTNAEAIKRATRGSVIAIHHTGKDKEKGARGSSALRGAVDTEIMVEKSEGLPNLKVRVTKQKDGEEGEPIRLRLVTTEVAHPKTGEVVASCVVAEDAAVVAGPPKRDQKLGKNQKAVYDFLAKGEGFHTAADIVDATGIEFSSALKAIDALTERGVVFARVLENSRVAYSALENTFDQGVS